MSGYGELTIVISASDIKSDNPELFFYNNTLKPIKIKDVSKFFNFIFISDYPEKIFNNEKNICFIKINEYKYVDYNMIIYSVIFEDSANEVISLKNHTFNLERNYKVKNDIDLVFDVVSKDIHTSLHAMKGLLECMDKLNDNHEKEFVRKVLDKNLNEVENLTNCILEYLSFESCPTLSVDKSVNLFRLFRKNLTNNRNIILSGDRYSVIRHYSDNARLILLFDHLFDYISTVYLADELDVFIRKTGDNEKITMFQVSIEGNRKSEKEYLIPFGHFKLKLLMSVIVRLAESISGKIRRAEWKSGFCFLVELELKRSRINIGV